LIFEITKRLDGCEKRLGRFSIYIDHWRSVIEIYLVFHRCGFGAIYSRWGTVLRGALSFALCVGGAWNSKERLEAASEGAVVCGWLRALIGAIGIASNWDSQLETLGPAVAVMLLTIMYGYFLKVVICLVLLSRNGN
jgi:hypothetical protein